MTERRKQKFKRVIDKRQAGLTVILEDVHDSHNILAVLRTCDAVGVREVYVVHTERVKKCKLSPSLTGKAAASATKWVQVHFFDDLLECFETVRQKYDCIYTTHLSESAVMLHDLNLCASIALVFGSERDGVSEQAVALSDGNFTIPQVGMIPSLNISVACAVTLYEAFRQRQNAGLYDVPSSSEQNRTALFEAWITREKERKKEVL